VPRPEPLEEKSEYRFEQGAVVTPNARPQPPVVGGKHIRITATISPVDHVQVSGPVIMIEEAIATWPPEPQMHGCVLYVKDNRLAMVVRHWREDTTVVAEEELPAGPATVEGILEQDGTVTLEVGGNVVARGKAPGSIPLRPGRKEATLPFVHVGVGHRWVQWRQSVQGRRWPGPMCRCRPSTNP
jgi:hypothetical protein